MKPTARRARDARILVALGTLGVVAALAASGCVESEPREKKIDPSYIKKNLLTAPPPAIQNQVNADLGGYVIYLGNDVDKTSLAPGGAVTVVHYWKVIASPGPEWRVFAHLVGPSGSWMNLDRTDMRLGYPPGDWKPGDIIRDEQKFTLDAGWKGPTAQIALGLYRKGSSRAEDRMRIESGPADDESRVLAFRFQVARAGAQSQPPTLRYLARRATGPITVDGAAGEKDWQSAPQSPAFTSAEGGREVKGATHARFLWDDSFLYVFVQLEDTDVHSQYKAQDDPLWKEDAVELFIDADRNRRGYVELQVNPRNAHFDAWFPRTRAQASSPEWNSSMKSAVAVRGTLDERDDQDQGWDVEIAIPLADVKGMDTAMKVAIPPTVGETWRLNVVRVDKPADRPLAASSWSPIPISDFHALGRMLILVFADENGAAPDLTPANTSPNTEPARTGAAEPAEPAKPGAAEPAKPAKTGAAEPAAPASPAGAAPTKPPKGAKGTEPAPKASSGKAAPG